MYGKMYIFTTVDITIANWDKRRQVSVALIKQKGASLRLDMKDVKVAH